MKRKYTIEIENKTVELNSSKEFSEFKKHYNKYDFMQIEQNNVWKSSLKNTTTITDQGPEPTIREVMKMLLEMKEILMRHEEIFKRNNLK